MNAEDVVQEAYTRAIQYHTAYDPEQSFDKWFGGILLNCMREFKKDERDKGVVNIDEIEEHPAVFQDPFFASIKNEVEARIRAKPAPLSYILRLHFIEQYSPADIEKLVDKTANAIRQDIHRFRNELREAYA